MAQQTLTNRVAILERGMESLEGLPDRVASLESQILQFRGDVRVEFSAVRREMHELHGIAMARMHELHDIAMTRMHELHDIAMTRMQELHDTLSARAETSREAENEEQKLPDYHRCKREHIRLQKHEYPHQEGQRDAVEEDVAENIAFVSEPARGGACHDN